MNTPGFLFWALLSALALPVAGRCGLRRLAPDAATEFMTFLPASIAGAVAGSCMHVMAAGPDTAVVMAQPESILLVALLVVAGQVDFRTAWAPSELVLPLCLVVGMVSPLGSSAGAPAAILAGSLFFAAAHVAWVIQLRIGLRCVPPADLIILAAPLLLFGASAASAMYYGAIAALLALARRVKALSRIRGCPAALAGAQADLSSGPGTRVALVGLGSPILVAALALQSIAWPTELPA